MDETRATDIADVGGAILVGLGIVTVAFFPFAVPLLILVIGPLALLALPLLLLALPLLPVLWLFRALRRRRRARIATSPSAYMTATNQPRERRYVNDPALPGGRA
jgi:hypothetical protein